MARLLESKCDSWAGLPAWAATEFAVVLPGCALARGQAVAEQLRQAVQAWAPSYQGSSFTLSMSIGLVALDASMQDVASVLYAADMACYDAKRAGRNRGTDGPRPRSVIVRACGAGPGLTRHQRTASTQAPQRPQHVLGRGRAVNTTGFAGASPLRPAAMALRSASYTLMASMKGGSPTALLPPTLSSRLASGTAPP